MDTITKQAWKYIKTLNYYAKTWKKPLEDLIYGLLDDMDSQGLCEDRQQFIEGIKNLKARKWLTGQVDIEQEPQESIMLDNVKLNIFFRIWFWLPYKWGNGNKEDIKRDTIKKFFPKVDIRKCIQTAVNGIMVISSIITIVEFVRHLMR